MKRPMAKEAVRVFLDSNVILSGFISDRGAPRIILDILCLKLPFLTGMTGRYNIAEIERNLTRKIPDAIPVYRQYFPELNLTIVPLPSADEVLKFGSHISVKDVPVIISAINGKADFLVTGDKKDFGKLMMKRDYPFRILSPSEFLDAIISEIVKFLESERPYSDKKL
jgi:predicted nucleic acid-binding protein